MSSQKNIDMMTSVVAIANAAKKLDGTVAHSVVMRWLSDYPIDRHGRWVIKGSVDSPTVIIKIKSKNVRKEEKSGKVWTSPWSRPIGELASIIITNSATKLGVPLPAIVSKRKKDLEVSKTRRVTTEHLISGKTLALKELAKKEPELVKAAIRGDVESHAALQKKLTELGEFYATFVFAAGRSVPGDESAASLDQPPFLPFYPDIVEHRILRLPALTYGRKREPILYAWEESGLGIVISNHKTHYSDDPTVNIRIGVGRIGERPRGEVAGRVWIHGNNTTAQMYWIEVYEEHRRRGVATTLIKAWCKMIGGYGIKRWSIDLDNEGAAVGAIKAMIDRGVLRFRSYDAKTVFVECV